MTLWNTGFKCNALVLLQISCHIHQVNLSLFQGLEQTSLSISEHDLGHGGLTEEPIEPVHAVLGSLPFYHLAVDSSRGRADKDHHVHVVGLVSCGTGHTEFLVSRDIRCQGSPEINQSVIEYRRYSELRVCQGAHDLSQQLLLKFLAEHAVIPDDVEQLPSSQDVAELQTESVEALGTLVLEPDIVNVVGNTYSEGAVPIENRNFEPDTCETFKIDRLMEMTYSSELGGF